MNKVQPKIIVRAMQILKPISIMRANGGLNTRVKMR